LVARDAGVVDEDRKAAVFLHDAVDQRFHRGTVGDVQHAAFAAMRGQPLRDDLRARVRRRGTDHPRAVRRQFVRDRGTNAARGTGDQRDFALQRVRHACTSASAVRNSAGVPSARASMDLSMRLHKPAKTLPGPHSKIFVAPFFTSDCTVSVHSTGMYNWRSSAARMNSMPACALASAFCSTGIAGTCHGNTAIFAANCCLASRINGVCEGTDTASLMTLRTPSS